MASRSAAACSVRSHLLCSSLRPRAAAVASAGSSFGARRSIPAAASFIAPFASRSLATLGAPSPHLPNIDASKLTLHKSTALKAKAAKETLKFGQSFTDHMLEIDWSFERGWEAPRIIPYGPLRLDPAASSLHYGLQIFEGMKAYLDSEGHMRMFRPNMNMRRLNNSATRLLMPNFDGEQFTACIQELLRLEKDWIPQGLGYSLYLRPTMISTHPYLGVSPSSSCKLYVICSPVGPYYPEGFNPIQLYADPDHVRAWPGGTGAAKCGGNYALGIRPAWEASQKGFSQVLWLFGEDLQVTEVGTMNQFFFIVNKETGHRELITAPLDGTILPGVTRDSILQLCREWGEFTVSERYYSLNEIMSASKDGRMIEAFGAGTAAIVAPVKGFDYKGTFYKIPLDKDDQSKKAGPLTQRLSDTLMGIQYGKIPHPWSIIVPEKGAL